jgi:WD40 repeat protein
MGIFSIFNRMKSWMPAIIFTLLQSLPGTSQQPSCILQELRYKTNPTCINFSPDGTLLLTGFQDGSFRLLDPETMEPSLEVPGAHVKAVNAMDMPPTMEFVLTAGYNQIKLWDLNGTQVGRWSRHATTIWNAEIDHQGTYAISSAFNRTFLIWDVYNGEVLQEMRGNDDVTMTVTFSHDGRWIASGSNDLTVRIWETETQSPVVALYGPSMEIYDVAFSPDNQLIAVASRDHSVRIYNWREETLVHLLQGHTDMAMEVDFSPDGRYLVSGSADKRIILWDVQSGERIYTFLGHQEAVLDLIFHPDGKSFYSVSFDKTLIRWGIDPEIFVMKYYIAPFVQELDNNPIFDPRQPGESRKDYQQRVSRADSVRSALIQQYYSRYLSERDP